MGVGVGSGADHRVLQVDPCTKCVRMRSYGIFRGAQDMVRATRGNRQREVEYMCVQHRPVTLCDVVGVRSMA